MAIFRQISRINCSELTSILAADCCIIDHVKAKKPSLKQVQAVRCPTCGAGPGEKCELAAGLPRTNPHRDRRLVSEDQIQSRPIRTTCSQIGLSRNRGLCAAVSQRLSHLPYM